MKKYFVTGIGTNVGKTLISALLCKYLKADYFKPIQSGTIEGTDSNLIKKLIPECITHTENYTLSLSASPHLAAAKENIKIDKNRLILPHTQNPLIIEGAGGLLVPINNELYIADLIKLFNAECILVISSYLGCINHALLSIDYIRNHNIPFKGIIFNGNFEQEIKSAILKKLQVEEFISEIPYVSDITPQTFNTLFLQFKNNLKTTL